MPTNERQTNGQSDERLTNAQLDALLFGIFLCLVGATTAVYFNAIVGFMMIAVTAFTMGYSCTSQKTLADIRRQMLWCEAELMIIVFMQFLMYAIMVDSYSSIGSHRFLTLFYIPVTLVTSLITACGCSLLGKMIRAGWKGF